MSYIRYAGEKKMSDIVASAYGALKPADAKRAEVELVRANPALANLAAIAPGTIVVVPKVAGAEPTAAAADDAAGQPVATARAACTEYIRRLTGAVAAARVALETEAAIPKSTAFKEIAKVVPDLKTWLTAATGGLKQRAADADRAEAFARRLEKASADFDVLAKQLSKK